MLSAPATPGITVGASERRRSCESRRAGTSAGTPQPMLPGDGGVLLCTSGFNPIDVEAASSEKAGNAAQGAGFILHQNRQCVLHAWCPIPDALVPPKLRSSQCSSSR